MSLNKIGIYVERNTKIEYKEYTTLYSLGGNHSSVYDKRSGTFFFKFLLLTTEQC